MLGTNSTSYFQLDFGSFHRFQLGWDDKPGNHSAKSDEWKFDAQCLPVRPCVGGIPGPYDRQLAGRQGDQSDPHLDLFLFYFSDATASQLFKLAAVVSIHGNGAKPCCGVPDLLLPDRWPRGLTHHLPTFFNVKNSGVGTHPTRWSARASGSFRGICFQQNLGRFLCHHY